MYDYNYGYGYDYGYDTAAGILGGMAASFGIIMLISLVLGVLMIIAQWKIFKKAGKGGWECLIPVYNIIVLLQIAELPTWYIVLFCLPFANIYAIFKTYIELAHKFGKSTGFGVGLVFLNPIFMLILGFGKNNVYQGENVQTNNSMAQNPMYANPSTIQNMYGGDNNMNQNNGMAFNQNFNMQPNPMPQMVNNVAPTPAQPMPSPQPEINVNQNMETIPQPIQTTPINNIPNEMPQQSPMQMPNQPQQMNTEPTMNIPTMNIPGQPAQMNQPNNFNNPNM